MSLKVVVNKTTNKVEVTSPGPQGNFYNSFRGNWSSATAYILGDIVFYNGSSYVAISNNTNSQPPSANWSAVAKGIPGGGTTGQIIVKNSSTDYDYSWTNNYSIGTTSPLVGGAAINTNPTLSINATADDTANYVVQRDANQSFAIGAVRFDTASAQTSAVGKLYWDGNETLNLGLGSTGTVTIAVGQEVISYVTNAEATTLNVGEVVYLFGASGDRPSVKRAANTSDTTSAKTFGIVAESIAAGAAGFVMKQGIVSKINTSAYTAGDILWLGATPGTFTTTKPVAPNHLVFVGVVLRTNASNGLVYTSPQNGYELDEIHDVLITSPTDGQFLTYESSTSLWKNKGVSATAPITYNTNTRTIAANAASTSASGVVQLSDSTSTTSSVLASTPTATKAAYDLANAAAPKTTSIGATAPITSSGTLGTDVTIGVNAASTSAAGVVQLSDSTSTTSSVLAATPTAVKAAYDLAAAAIPLTQKAAANGVATLDASGLVPTNQLPALAITDTFVVASQAAMLALTAETGDVAVRTDVSKSFILTASPASTLANWQELLTPPDAVSSVDGRTGTVTLTDKYAQLATANTFTVAPQTISINAAANNGLVINAAASQSGDLTLWRDSSANVLARVSGSGNITAPTFTVTSSTVPANGIYLPTTNSVGIAAGSIQVMRFAPTGEVVVGSGAITANNVLTISRNLTGGTSASSVYAVTSIQSDVTSVARGFNTFISTANTNFAISTLEHFRAEQGTFSNVTAGGSVSTQRGFSAGASMVNATENIGFYGNIPSGSSRWNFYANGTAANYFAGQTTVGSTSLTLGSGSVAQQFGIVSTAATNVGAVIRGAASQSGSLQQWQNSAGTILVQINSTGNFVSTVTGSANDGFGQIYLNGATLNRIDFNVNGVAAPSFTTRSAGTKIVLYPSIGASSADYAFGVEGSILWSGVPSSAQNFRWYAGTTAVALLTGSGQLSVNSTSTTLGSESIAHQFGVVSGATTNVVSVVRGAASQSADLIQLQNSSGTVLDAFDNAGNQRSQAQLVQYGAEGSILQNIPTRVHPAETLLKQAVWWIDAAHPSASSQTINNLGWGGSALNVTNGSSTAADTNDAQYLAWDGVNYAYMPGVNGNYLSAPDATNLRVTGDIDLRAYVTLDNWVPSANSGLISKTNGSGNFSWVFRVLNTGALSLVWTTDGTTTIAATSSVNPTVSNGQGLWVRATLSVASNYAVNFYTSTNGSTWTQLGSTVTGAGATSIYASNSPVEIGTYYGGSTAPISGKIFRAQILNGIDGTPVLDVDTSLISSGSATSFTALTGQTVTINRSTSGRKTVAVTTPLWLFGTDDYMEVNNRWLEHTGSNYLYLPGVASNYASTPDAAALDITGDIDIRAKVALDDWTPTIENMVVCKSGAAGTRSYSLSVANNGTLRLYTSNDGTNIGTNRYSSVAPTITDGATLWIRATLDVDNGASGSTTLFYTSTDGSTWTQLGTAQTSAGITSIFSGTAPLEIGVNQTTSSPYRGKIFRAQVLNGIDGTVAFDANFETGITSNLPTTFTESSANAATVTINYSGSGYRSAGVTASTYVFPGNPNTFKLSNYSFLDFGASDDFTAIAVSRIFSTNASFGTFLMKGQAASNGGQRGYMIYNNGTAASVTSLVSDGTNQSGTGNLAYTYGATTLFGIQRNVGTDQVITLVNSTTTAVADITTGSLATPFALTIGSGSTVKGSYLDGEFISAAIFRRALTAAEIATLNNYFQGRVA